MSDVIYVVFGVTGEYSDRSEWPVCWYESRPEAEAHAKAARRYALEIAASDDYDLRFKEGANPFDPHMRIYYTGTDYSVAEVSRGRMAAEVKP